LFCRPDGALYFIPDDVLEQYRLSTAESAEMRAELGQDDDVQGHSLMLPPLIEPLATVVARPPIAPPAPVLCTAV
jgi:hypothetical protein